MNRQLICIVSYFCLLVLVISTCTSDELQTDPKKLLPPDEEQPELVEITTKSPVDLSNPEDSVAKVRWIILSTGGRVLVNQCIKADSIAKLTVNHIANIEFRALLPKGYADFFMIANELSAWNLDSYNQSDVLFAETLKGMMTNYTAYLPTWPSLLVNDLNLIPMAGIYEHLYAANGRIYNKDTNADVDVGVIERLYAKATFEITALFIDQDNDGDSIDIKSIKMKNLPKHSYLFPYLYMAPDVSDGAVVTPTAANYKGTNFVNPDSCFRGVFSFYIPEYLLTDTSKYTYASVIVNLRSDPDAQREYRIVVANGIQSHDNAWLLNPAQPGRGVTDLRISRNKHYYFNAHIINFDLRGEQQLEIHPVILEWGVAPVDSALIRDYTLTVSQDKFTLPSGTVFNGIIKVFTDHPEGWEAVVTGSGHTKFPDYSNSAATPSNLMVDFLKFDYDGTAYGLPTAPRDTIHIKAGRLTKKIIITNPGTI